VDLHFRRPNNAAYKDASVKTPRAIDCNAFIITTLFGNASFLSVYIAMVIPDNNTIQNIDPVIPIKADPDDFPSLLLNNSENLNLEISNFAATLIIFYLFS